MSNKICKFLIVGCLILFCNCTNNGNVDELITIYSSSIDKKESYTIKYNQSEMVLINSSIHGNITKVDSTIFYKKSNGYYDRRVLENQIFSKTPKTESLLSFSTKKDTFYTYRNLLGEFYCEVNKVNGNRFKTTFAFKDSLKLIYKTIIYYDKNYKIQRIEENLNKDSIVFISKKNKIK